MALNTQNNILVFDTATTACSVALKTSKGVFSRHREEANVHSQALLAMIDELLIESSLNLGDIDFLAVGVGPGSFTGLRIGIGVAQGLAYSNHIDLIAISTLEMIALNAMDLLTGSNQSGQLIEKIVVAHDARMSEIYSVSYVVNAGSRMSTEEGILLSSPKDVFIPEGNVLLCGNAWFEYANEFDELIQLSKIEEISFFPNAEKVVTYIDKNFLDFKTLSWQELLPVYVRNDVAKKAKVRPKTIKT